MSFLGGAGRQIFRPACAVCTPDFFFIDLEYIAWRRPVVIARVYRAATQVSVPFVADPIIASLVIRIRFDDKSRRATVSNTSGHISATFLYFCVCAIPVITMYFSSIVPQCHAFWTSVCGTHAFFIRTPALVEEVVAC
jgi:hypothetical protein